jgi:sugar lactone lactonase YvrE
MFFAACSSNDALTATNPPPSNQVAQGAERRSKSKLLYVSDELNDVIDIYSVPGYSRVGQISNGIEDPEGIATDKNGNLYVANFFNGTVTIYKPNTTSPYRTLTDPHALNDVAVTKNGYVVAGDYQGGVDVFAPGGTSPSTRLTNSGISSVSGVGVDANNNVYAAGTNASSEGVVIEYADMSGGGTNLGLQDLESPRGVLIDKDNNVVVSDVGAGKVLIYPQGRKARTITLLTRIPGKRFRRRMNAGRRRLSFTARARRLRNTNH